MDEIKAKVIDEVRINFLKEDLAKLREGTYHIIGIDYEKKTITISGFLFDLKKWHCLYVNPYGNNGELILEY